MSILDSSVGLDARASIHRQQMKLRRLREALPRCTKCGSLVDLVGNLPEVGPAFYSTKCMQCEEEAAISTEHVEQIERDIR